METGIAIQVAFFTVGIVYADGETFCIVDGFDGQGVGGEKDQAEHK